MKITVLSTLLLGCLLAMTVQGDSSSRVVPETAGKEGNKNKLGVVFAQKEPFLRAGAGHMMRKLGLGEKKFSRNEVTSTVDYSKNGEGTSKISGKDNNDGLKKTSGSRDQKNDDQKLMSTKPEQYLKSTTIVIPRRLPNSKNQLKCSEEDCNADVSVKSSSYSSPEARSSSISADETQRFAEIANMMNKDYHGKPSHRPPINNNDPKN